MNRLPESKLEQSKVGELCRLHYEAVYRYIAYRIPSKEDSEDLTSEVFLRALNSRQESCASAAGWLFSIAENLIIDFYRRRSTRTAVLETNTNGELPDAPAPTSDPHQLMDLSSALKSLSGEHYQVVFMRFIEGYSIQEVALAIGKTEGATKALQFRALTKLRGLMKEEEHARS